MKKFFLISIVAFSLYSCDSNRYPADRDKNEQDMPYQSENSPNNAATGTNANYDSSAVSVDTQNGKNP